MQFSFWPKSLSLMLKPLLHRIPGCCSCCCSCSWSGFFCWCSGPGPAFRVRGSASPVGMSTGAALLQADLQSVAFSLRPSVVPWRRVRPWSSVPRPFVRLPKADALQRTSSRDIEFCVQQRKAHTKPGAK